MTDNPLDLLELQLATQGVGCLKVTDGHIFHFTAELLQQLLAKATAATEGKVVVFVRHGVTA